MANQDTNDILPWNNARLEELLRDLIAHGTEATKVDFKTELELNSAEQKAELLKDITAFANSYDDSNGDHGFLIYGVKAKTIAGVSATETNTDNLQNTIDQLLRDNIDPMPKTYVLGFEEPTGEKWGVIVMPPRDDKPYMFFKDFSCQNPSKSRKKGEWFVRKGTTTSPGLPEDLSRITRRQSELQLLPLRESVRALQGRAEQLERRYDDALFKLLSELAARLKDAEGPNRTAPVTRDEAEKQDTSARLAFSTAVPKDGSARFRAKGEALGFDDDIFGGNQSKEVFLPPGPAMWLRLIPINDPGRTWPTSELRRLAMEKNASLLPLWSRAGGYSYLRASDGEGMYRVAGNQEQEHLKLETTQTPSVGFAFRTGEIWSIDTALLTHAPDKLFSVEIEREFTAGLERYEQYLVALGLSHPYRWIAGLENVKGRRLQYPPPPGHVFLDSAGPICASITIEAQGQRIAGERAATTLLPFFRKIFEECGIERPDYLPR